MYCGIGRGIRQKKIPHVQKFLCRKYNKLIVSLESTWIHLFFRRCNTAYFVIVEAWSEYAVDLEVMQNNWRVHFIMKGMIITSSIILPYLYRSAHTFLCRARILWFFNFFRINFMSHFFIRKKYHVFYFLRIIIEIWNCFFCRIPSIHRSGVCLPSLKKTPET